MNQQQFEAVIRNKIEAIGDGEKQRRYIYQSLRDKMLALAAKSPGDTERWSGIHAAFNAAVEAVEKGYETTPDSTPADAGPATVDGRAAGPAAPTASASPAAAAHFRSPDETPKSAAEYFWIKVVAGCAALGGVLDFLKPIVDLQSPSVVIAALAAIALTVASRLSPTRAGMFSTLRNVSLAVAAAVIGLFGLQSQFPGNAPNGAIAEVLPGLVQLQSTIEGLRAPIEKIGQDTGRIAETTDKMTKQLEEIAESSDGAAIAREALRRAGHDLDADSLYEAIVSNDGTAFYFEEAGFIASDSEVDAMLAKAPSDADKFEQVLGFYLNYGPAAHRRRVKGDLEGLLEFAGRTKSLDPLFESVCDTSTPGVPAWVAARLSQSCDNLSRFFMDAVAILERNPEAARVFGRNGPTFTVPRIEAASVADFNTRTNNRVASLGYLEGILSFEYYTVYVMDPANGERAGISPGDIDEVRRPCLEAAGDGVCTARVYFRTDSAGSITYLGASNIVRGSIDGRSQYAAAVAGDPGWRLAAWTSDHGNTAVAGAYSGDAATSAMLVCAMGASAGAAPQLSVRLDAKPGDVAGHVDNPDPAFVGGSHQLLIAFNGNGNGWPADIRPQQNNVVAVAIHAEIADAMRSGTTMEIFLDGRLKGQVSLAGFTAAYEKLRELTRCGW